MSGPGMRKLLDEVRAKIASGPRVPTPIRNILSMVAMDTRVAIKKMVARSDDDAVLQATALAMWLARKAGHDPVEIARVFNVDAIFVNDAAAWIDGQIPDDPYLAGWLGNYELVLTVPAR